MSTSDNNATSLHGELVAFLTDNNDMRKCAKNSVKASVWAGGGACMFKDYLTFLYIKCIFTHQEYLFSFLKILQFCKCHSYRSCWSFSHGTSWWNGRRYVQGAK